jgi:hypothetical protein
MDDTLPTALWLSVVVSIVLTIRALVSRSWLTMWAAALFLFPFVLSSVGILTIPLTALQLAAAGALRRNASAWVWAAFIAASAVIWIAVIYSARFTSFVWVGGFPLLPLSLLALLVPLLPIGTPRPQTA